MVAYRLPSPTEFLSPLKPLLVSFRSLFNLPAHHGTSQLFVLISSAHAWAFCMREVSVIFSSSSSLVVMMLSFVYDEEFSDRSCWYGIHLVDFARRHVISDSAFTLTMKIMWRWSDIVIPVCREMSIAICYCHWQEFQFFFVCDRWTGWWIMFCKVTFKKIGLSTLQITTVIVIRDNVNTVNSIGLVKTLLLVQVSLVLPVQSQSKVYLIR